MFFADTGVGFRDLKFERHAFVQVRTASGALQHRWAPLGMPRIPERLERCVFFMFGLNPNNGCLEGPSGTGFFVGRPSATLVGMYHVYAVSNAHVVNPHSSIRINAKNGGTRFIELDPAEWEIHEAEDLAVADVTEYLPFDPETYIWEDSIAWVDERNFLTDINTWSDSIGIGNDTVMVGLFVDHDGGGKKNVPVGRFGSLAAMPDPLTPVRLWQGDKFSRAAYLNDTHSRSGFSGSPVWVWGTPYDDMNTWHGHGLHRERLTPRNQSFLYLVGVHRGQFREMTVVGTAEAGRPLASGDEIEIASSMTVVIPAWEISHLLDRTNLQDQRDVRDTREDRRRISEVIAGVFRRQEGL